MEKGQKMENQKFVLLGDVDAGKTSLCNALYQHETPAIKTQQVEYVGENAVDLPGEYTTIPHMRMALLSTLNEARCILYVEPADDSSKKTLSNDFLSSLENKILAGIITKVDKPNMNKEAAYTELKRLGICAPIFEVSIYDEASINPLRQWLMRQELITVKQGSLK